MKERRSTSLGSFGVRAMMMLDMMMMIVLKMIAMVILNVVSHGHWSTLNIIIVGEKVPLN